VQTAGALVLARGPPPARRRTSRTRGTGPTRGRNGLDGIVESDVQPVDPETPVADLFARCANSPFPVPVTDEDGKLLGVISKVTLLAALGSLNGNGGL
jgi:glycine betaine/proline transport system ATP-binding protein